MFLSYLALTGEFADCLHEHNVKYHSLENNLYLKHGEITENPRDRY
jgi:hypothetical protein